MDPKPGFKVYEKAPLAAPLATWVPPVAAVHKLMVFNVLALVAVIVKICPAHSLAGETFVTEKTADGLMV